MKVAIPHMGDYTKIIKHLEEYLDWEIIIPPIPNQETIDLGTGYISELMCLPAKITLGSLAQSCKKGARELLMFDSCGECRLKTYWILQQRALTKQGYDVKVHPIRLGRHTPGDIRKVDPAIPYWKSWWAFIKVLHEIFTFDKKMSHVMMDESEMVKIGIIGEIYTILESAINMNLVQKIEKMGALAHNSLPLSYFIFKGLYDRGWMKRPDVDRNIWLKAKRLSHKYFPLEIGGHANESVTNIIYYAMKGFDGVIHVLPFPCAPEAVVAPILDEISHDLQIPLIRLIFDTHTAEAGVDTRIEAFVDILSRKKRAVMKRG